MQSFGLGAVHLAGMHVAPPVDAKVRPDVSCAYQTHAGAISPAYEYAQWFDAINPQC